MPAAKKTGRSPAKAERPKPAWRRVEAGSYRSADDRFSMNSEGTGRWFLRDAEQPDDFAQPRTLGPFATLDEARAAAEAQRGQASRASPLVKRLEARRSGRGAGTGVCRGPSRGERRRQGGAASHGSPTRAPMRSTWLDRLDERDAAAARRARALVRALGAVGFADAEEVVRKDVEGGRPAVAETTLARALREAVSRALDPGSLLPGARRRVPGLSGDEEDLNMFAAFVAARVVDAILGEISVGEGGERRARDLPGWRLSEDGGAGRRLVVTPRDVLGGR